MTHRNFGLPAPAGELRNRADRRERALIVGMLVCGIVLVLIALLA